MRKILTGMLLAAYNILTRDKHEFDLDNPVTVDTGFKWPGGKSITFQRYECTKCKKGLCLDYGQMLDLPFEMQHGCKPKLSS